MIKRDGVQILNPRAGNVALARETIKICKDKTYISPSGNDVSISEELNFAVKNSILYKEGEEIPSHHIMNSSMVVEVINETTAQAAFDLKSQYGEETDVVALNFAAALNQGGGYLVGASAQEEDLCRASGLYSCLKNKPMFYNINHLAESYYYTDSIIYSPKVPFIRDKNNVLLEKPFNVSIITSPAPCLIGVEKRDDEMLSKVLSRRMERILKIAAFHGHKKIVLGAWGCGAFCNDPIQVATLFRNALIKHPAFEHVCFAVYDRRNPPHLFETFSDILK
jgi:uncharacterized protein (TIGR02452 family)